VLYCWRGLFGAILMMTLLGAILGERRSEENPQTPLGSDDSWGTWDSYMGPTTSGQKVNRVTALSAAAVWRGVNLIARDVAKLHVDVMRAENGGLVVDRKHPAQRIVSRKPNPYMTAFHIKQTITAHAVLEGNGYAYVYRDAAGRPIDVLPLSPSATFPVRWNGQLWFITSVTDQGAMPLYASDGQSINLLEMTSLRRLPAEDVIHIRGLGYDGLMGYPVLQYARETIGGALATRTYRTTFFKNNGAPNIVIEYPGVLTNEAIEKIRKTWGDLHAGLHNAHKTAVLANGMKLNAFGIDARKAQLIEAEQWEVKEVANVIGVPPHKLGASDNQGYGSREQDEQRYLDEALMPWLETWEQEMDDKLLTEEEKESGGVHCKFRMRGLIRGDMVARAQYYHGAIQDGWMSRDEVRSEEELNPLPDGEGTKFFVPLNMGTTGGLDKDEADALEFKRRVVLAFILNPNLSDEFFATVDNDAVLEALGIPTAEDVDRDKIREQLKQMHIDLMAEGSGGAEQVDRAFRAIIKYTKDRRKKTESLDIDLEQARKSADLACHDAWQRMNRRVSIQAKAAAKKPDSFVEWIEDIERENADIIAAAVGPAERCRAAVNGWADTVDAMVRDYCATRREELLGAAECKPADLPKAIDRWSRKLLEGTEQGES
jgi:HK97 family phage portal protein